MEYPQGCRFLHNAILRYQLKVLSQIKYVGGALCLNNMLFIKMKVCMYV